MDSSHLSNCTKTKKKVIRKVCKRLKNHYKGLISDVQQSSAVGLLVLNVCLYNSLAFQKTKCI